MAGASGSAAFPAAFRSLEEDFVDSKMAINNSVTDILHNDTTAATAAQIAQTSVVEAQRCIKMMSVEVRGKPPMLRKAMQAKINVYRDELQGLQRDLERAQLMAREAKTKQRTSIGSDHYERITENTDRLLRTLESSQRMVAETEQIGISVLDTLAQQRESLLASHDKVRETRELTSDARRVLQRMTRRIFTNRIVLYSVIATLVIAICLVIYYDFIRPRSRETGFFGYVPTVLTRMQGTVSFPSARSASFRYEIRDVGDSLSLWLEDRETKHQWKSTELSETLATVNQVLASQVPQEDCVVILQKCFEEAASGSFSDCRCDLLEWDGDADAADKALELEFEVVLKVYSVVWKPKVSVLLQPIPLAPIQIAEAKLRDQEEELASLRLSLRTATEELERARDRMTAKALFLEGSSRELKKHGVFHWEPCKGVGSKSVHCDLINGGWVRFRFAGAYRVELLVWFPHHTLMQAALVVGSVLLVEQHFQNGVLKHKWNGSNGHFASRSAMPKDIETGYGALVSPKRGTDPLVDDEEDEMELDSEDALEDAGTAEEEPSVRGASVPMLMAISLPRVAIQMTWSAQWAALGPYLGTMLPPYAVQLAQIIGPATGILVAPTVGVFSDNCTSRWGRRRPFLFVASLLSVVCWALMGYTRQFGEALGDYGSGQDGEPTRRPWTAAFTVFFYLWMDVSVNVVQTPMYLMIADFSGDRQTLGASIGQGWSTIGSILVAGYIYAFGAAHKSLRSFLAMLSVVMLVTVLLACFVGRETPLAESRMAHAGGGAWQQIRFAFGAIYAGLKGLPRVLVVYCVVFFCVMYGYTAYNGNKGQFFGYEVYGGEAEGADVCGSADHPPCSMQQDAFNDGVSTAGGSTDLLFNIVGYLFSWALPVLVKHFGAKWVLVGSLVPQSLLMVMAFTRVVWVDVAIVILTSLSQTTVFALLVPVIVHVFGDAGGLGVYVGALNSANCFGQLLNFVVGAAIVETPLGYKLPVFVGGVMSFIGVVIAAFFLKLNITAKDLLPRGYRESFASEESFVHPGSVILLRTPKNLRDL
ncbi:hypothetical protein PybrP1_007592 [[Pythium] brassicae (nom. inval.)]|nr:hypothetical protein PybrP1_007592 [[Pythium] brassicae (nom. inval.)]